MCFCVGFNCSSPRITEELASRGVLTKEEFNLHTAQRYDKVMRTLNKVTVSATTTVMILNFRTDRSGQTVQTQIRLLLEEQSDQGLHCLLFRSHLFDEIP